MSDTHGSPELDEDAAKLREMGADPGPTWAEISAAPWNGIPEHPELSGWHWLRHRTGAVEPHEWLGDDRDDDIRGWNAIPGTPEEAAAAYSYVGQCLLPDDVDALQHGAFDAAYDEGAKNARTEAGDRIRDLSDMLRRAARQFRTYQAHHLAKDTPESRAKADVNGELANSIEALLHAQPASAPEVKTVRTMDEEPPQRA